MMSRIWRRARNESGPPVFIALQYYLRTFFAVSVSSRLEFDVLAIQRA